MFAQILFYIASFCGYAIIQLLFLITIKGQASIMAHIITWILAIVFYVLELRYFKYFENKSFKEKGLEVNWKGKISMKNIGILAVGVVSMLTIQLLAAFLLKTTSNNQQALLEIAQKDISFYLLVGVVAPFFEELIFRQFFFNCFSNLKLNGYIQIVLNGLFFSVMHESRLDFYFPVYWLLGSILALIYLKTKDLKCSIIAHSINNLVALGSIFL
ncbi:type II CAAX endopeptidase family protein [Lactobacillus jensenii]|uniref:Type II CAAX endopeptidase family protein n=1 Tax=Lactobacillus jensenii TaxID=109790 RepID=A0ABU9FHJ3_LACJE|nr:type II CAAX endopeptidase family protein [Lactobacillus jensenii]MDT9544961.1 type II CAAX endopeptidase family protein [Lactobacillus jensenii]